MKGSQLSDFKIGGPNSQNVKICGLKLHLSLHFLSWMS